MSKMMLVHYAQDGVLELNWMWLPTWLGMNNDFKAGLESHIRGLKLDAHDPDHLLWQVHMKVIDYIEEKFTDLEGLRFYLEAVSQVEVG